MCVRKGVFSPKIATVELLGTFWYISAIKLFFFKFIYLTFQNRLYKWENKYGTCEVRQIQLETGRKLDRYGTNIGQKLTPNPFWEGQIHKFTPECIRSGSSNRSGSGSGSCRGSASSGSCSGNIVNSSSCHSILEWLISKIGEGIVEG